MIKATTPPVGVIHGPTVKQSAITGVGNGAPEKAASSLKTDTHVHGRIPANEWIVVPGTHGHG